MGARRPGRGRLIDRDVPSPRCTSSMSTTRTRSRRSNVTLHSPSCSPGSWSATSTRVAGSGRGVTRSGTWITPPRWASTWHGSSRMGAPRSCGAPERRRLTRARRGRLLAPRRRARRRRLPLAELLFGRLPSRVSSSRDPWGCWSPAFSHLAAREPPARALGATRWPLWRGPGLRLTRSSPQRGGRVRLLRLSDARHQR